jgi:hypothetical protein
MKKEDYLFLNEWFNHYVKSFYSKDRDVQHHIIIKEEHTSRVCENMRNIGRFLKLDQNHMLIAETVALLHDVGRFWQYTTYHTFNDFLSEDHAALGVKVLNETNILSCLDGSEQRTIKQAILYHNYRELPNEEGLLFAKMIRDADKLDIFEMIVTDDVRLKIPKSPELGDGEGYSYKIVEDLLNNRLARYEDMKTAADQTLFRVSWLYNIYFTYSFRYMLKHQYLARMLGRLPQTEDIKSVRSHIDVYLKEKAGVR